MSDTDPGIDCSRTASIIVEALGLARCPTLAKRYLRKHTQHRVSPVFRQRLPNRLTGIAHRVIPATGPAREAPPGPVSAIQSSRSNYQRHHEWDIELFFRWIKQMLKLRHFYGVSENAVRLQIAVALIAFVLIKLAHRTRHAVDSVTRFGRLIRATILHRTPLDRLGLPGPPIAGAIQNHDQGVFSWA